MEIAEHIAAIAGEGERLAAAAAAAGPDTPVPSCPDWVVRDLVRHQGGIHRWATGIVAGPRTEAWNVELDEVVGSWPADAGLIGWFGDGLGRLTAALSAADHGLDCWTFLAAPSAADGIDELLTCFITRRGGRLRSAQEKSLRVRCADTPRDWLFRIGPDRVVTTASGSGAGSGTGSGTGDCQLAAN